MVGPIDDAAVATNWWARRGLPLALEIVVAAGASVAEAPVASPSLQEAAAMALQAAGWHGVAMAAGEPVADRH